MMDVWELGNILDNQNQLYDDGMIGVVPSFLGFMSLSLLQMLSLFACAWCHVTT